MNQVILKSILERAEHWAEEDVEDLADYARVIEARRTDTYRVSEEEREVLIQAVEETERGDFAADDLISAAAKCFN
ncbi:hypothetical protein [Chelativorans sp.]|uniref:hypothetical protein n=1 Tax=Chelativorans sp. TaxID=2203393 RepID=UPI0028111EED|nr:hypothetical protein [Chelativorans sp.]